MADKKSQPNIVNDLKHLNVNKMIVLRTIKRLNDTGNIAKRNTGGPKITATSPEMVRKMQMRINEIPSVDKLTKDLNVSKVQRIINIYLYLKPYKIQKGQDSTRA